MKTGHSGEAVSIEYTVTAKVYNKHLYLEEKRRAVDAWDRELARILANEPKKAAKVKAFRKRA